MSAGVNGMAAARTLLSFRNIDHGMCLHYVWQAYKAHGARANGSWPTAYAAWRDTPGKHEGDWNPPAGVPVWFGPRAGSAAGDVVISLGGGRVACTDYPGWGQTGSCTITERQRQIGRPYLGWTETILGAAIDYGQSPAPAGQKEEDDMFTDEDRDRLMNVYNAMFFGGPSMNDGGRSVAFSLANLTAFADRIDKAVAPIIRNVDGVDTPIPLRQEVADAKTNTLALLGRPVNEVEITNADAIATALAPLLDDLLGKLSDADVARIAERAADENDRRARERLDHGTGA